MANEEEKVVSNDDGVVVEDPVVEDSDENEDEGVEDTGSSKRLKFIGIIVALSVACVYFLFFKDNSKQDIVDNSSIVFNDGGGYVNRDNSILNDSGLLNKQAKDQTKEDSEYSVKEMVPTIPDSEIVIPDLPTFSNNLTTNIESEIAKEVAEKNKNRAFSKEEVDELISKKLQAFEKQMDIMKKNNENLLVQFKRKEEQLTRQMEEDRIKNERLLREKDRELKQMSNISSKGIVSPGQSSTTNRNTTNQSGKSINLFGQNDNSSAVNGSSVGENSEEQADVLKKQEEQIKKAQKNRALAERRGAPIFKMQGGGGGGGNTQEQDSIVVLNKDLLVNIKDTKSSVEATKVPDLSRVIIQGKIIDAILESAIDTDGTAQIRAVVTRDVYAEYGKNILIPKGSRAIGTFSSTVTNGVARVGIVWNRIIRVDGLSLNINANATDRIGRGGVPGDLDNKYLQIMRNSFLTSMISVGSALAVEGISNSTGISNTTNGNSSTTTSGKASDYALVNATQDFMDDMEDIIDGIKDEKPTIRIPQGTKIIIMVNQDLTLPIYKKSK